MAIPKISIVTPSFNQGLYIEKTILSIITQGYPNLEYIIIDGGSTDNTIDIIRKYEQHISYWVSEPDKGQSDALNKGLSKCTGDIFNWINSDDYLADNALFKIADYFTKNASIDVVCGWCSLFDEETLKENFKHQTEIFPSLEETLVEQRINQPASFYRLGVVKQVGGVNQALHYVMDLDLWFRYLAAYGQKAVLLVDDFFAYFRLHTASKTVQLQLKFREEERLLWYHLLQQLQVQNTLTSFFRTSTNYNNLINWNCRAINRQKLINFLCKKYLIEFYKTKNVSAARFAFFNQLKAGNLRLQRNYVGMFYHLFLRLS
ncbi:glycosyltransferase family 2 protein [Segetibacter aerophilus]|uniref:Glycosyltransferase 2-like domain-containing protein n=1 Tax=Segetibacter aerophilus TaxID=670293 RepID=A0A512B6L8_9BACT|nr:glycosyltransferase family 2 protein [Segetibacter aerophilus]GEO07613.1 hypothetical protein SAE01_01090 [Segetibacter aerophilus]